MMTVRFPTGLCIQYNKATYAYRHGNGYTDLYQRKGTGEEKGVGWIAQVPMTGAIIESEPACRVYTAGMLADETERSIANLERRMSRLTRAVERRLPRRAIRKKK